MRNDEEVRPLTSTLADPDIARNTVAAIDEIYLEVRIVGGYRVVGSERA